jgi:hypothetical protein
LSCELSPIREVFFSSFVTHFVSLDPFVFVPPIRLMLMPTPRVLGTLACVCCFCECFFLDEEVISRVEEDFSPNMLHHGSGAHSLRDGMSLDSWRFSSSVPPQHEAAPLSHHPVHVDMPPIDDDDDISIYSHEELSRFKSLCVREFAHTHVYDVTLLKRVGLDIELPTVI